MPSSRGDDRLKNKDRRDRDQEIYRRLRQRDPLALEELIHRYSRRLMVLIRRILGGFSTPEDVEETLADVFVIVWYEIEQYDPQRAPLATWMWMQAKYAALNRRRELKRRRDTTPLNETRAPPGMKRALRDRATHWDLHRLLGELPQLERELIYRRYFLQESLQEIAQEVGLTVNAVRNRLWRTRKQLRGLIQQGAIAAPLGTRPTGTGVG